MREIKFRVWYPKSWTDDDQPIFEMTYDWAFEDYAPLNDLLANPGENVTFMQFTGLKDANNKEIYEGDIIESSDSQGSPIRHSIIYEECSFKGDYGFSSSTISQQWINEFKKKVVGNIYETPNLIP